jgi:hypothetical protein
MNLQEYLNTIAAELANELNPILKIKGVTANSDLLGKYAEAAVRSLVRRMIHPMRSCTGAVLDFPIPARLRQIDIIIWAPFPMPALFDVEGFGLVPKSSAFGVIEVKMSNYSSDVDEKLENFIADVEARKIVADPAGPLADYKSRPGIGVVCLLESAPSSRLQSLIDDEKVVAIFERGKEDVKLRSKDILHLANFLHYVTWRYRVQSSAPSFPGVVTRAQK